MRLIKAGAHGGRIWPTDEIARAAASALASMHWLDCRPVKYDELVREAWRRVGWVPARPIDEKESAEHLRFCAQDARKCHGLDYLSEARLGERGHKDVGLVFLAEWMDKHQLRFFNNGFEDSGHFDIDATVAGATNATLRHRYMPDSYGRSPKRIAEQHNYGSIVEEHISNRFKEKWKGLWLPATNYGQHEKWSRDDFQMNIPCRGRPTTLFNVKARRDASGVYRPMSDAPPADIYLITTAVGDSWYLFGWCTAEEFARGDVRRESTRSLDTLGNWLNCVDRGIDYAAMTPERRVYRPSHAKYVAPEIRNRALAGA